MGVLVSEVGFAMFLWGWAWFHSMVFIMWVLLWVFGWVGDCSIGCCGLGAGVWCVIRKWKWYLLTN